MAKLNWQWLSLSQTCQRLKSGQASAMQLTKEMLERAQTLNDQTRCYASFLADEALAAALALDQKQAAGEPLGLLHGVPIGIKDLLYTQGVPTASGTLVMKDFRPPYSATVVDRLRNAGAVLLGKTQLTEGAFGKASLDWGFFFWLRCRSSCRRGLRGYWIRYGWQHSLPFGELCPSGPQAHLRSSEFARSFSPGKQP